MNYVDNGFVLGSRNKVFSIAGMAVKNIIIYTKHLACVLVTEKVMTKFQKLIVFLISMISNLEGSSLLPVPILDIKGISLPYRQPLPLPLILLPVL